MIDGQAARALLYERAVLARIIYIQTNLIEPISCTMKGRLYRYVGYLRRPEAPMLLYKTKSYDNVQAMQQIHLAIQDYEFLTTPTLAA